MYTYNLLLNSDFDLNIFSSELRPKNKSKQMNLIATAI